MRAGVPHPLDPTQLYLLWVNDRASHDGARIKLVTGANAAQHPELVQRVFDPAAFSGRRWRLSDDHLPSYQPRVGTDAAAAWVRERVWFPATLVPEGCL